MALPLGTLVDNESKKALNIKKPDSERHQLAVAEKMLHSVALVERKANASTVGHLHVAGKTGRKCHKFQIFTSSSESETENNPKKVRCSVKSRKKGVKRIGTNFSTRRASTPYVKEGAKKLKYDRTPSPNPVLDYPSIETFRDEPAEHGLDSSLVTRDEESLCVRSFQQSMSVSFLEGVAQVDRTANTLLRSQHSFSFSPPWLPSGIRQRSFIKIKTPAQIAVESPQTETLEGNRDEKDSSSYTSVCTWVTATGSAINATTQTGGEAQAPEKKGRTERRDSSPGSPTLVLKSPQLTSLHSTAIHPSHNIHHLQHTPHVSPIKFHPDDDRRRHTPPAPTHHLSPRGPRKSQSFITLPSHDVQPKCSTMLFATPLAHTGGVPLDVSSIRMALPDALDQETTPSTVKNKQSRSVQEEPERDGGGKFLTSTPHTGGCRKLMWNLSCVYAPSVEDELVPLERSGDTVNSQEIMGATLTDESVRTMDDQEVCAHTLAAVEQEEQAQGPIQRPHLHPESGIIPDSLPHTSLVLAGSTQHRHTAELSSLQRSQKPPAMEESSQRQHSNLPQSRGSRREEACDGSSLDGGKNSALEGKEKEDDDVVSAEAKEGVKEGKLGRNNTSMNKEVVQVLPDPDWAPRLPFGMEDSKSSETSDSSYNYHLSIDDNLNISPRKKGRPQQRRIQARQKLLAQFDSEMEVCPVSAIGRAASTGQQSKAHLFLWVVPPDSGFCDMISQAPPDIVGMVSKQSIKSTSACH